MITCADELRGIAGRMVAMTLPQACDGAALVEDFLAMHRLADEVARLEEALRPRTPRELEGCRRSGRLARRIAGVIRRVFHHPQGG